MNQELQDRLYEEFPLSFIDKDAPLTESCMGWGIDTEDGWFGLVYEAASKLEPLVEKWINDNPDKEFHPRVGQVKQKLGSLRFYIISGTDEMTAIEIEALKKSYEVCEKCEQKAMETNRGILWHQIQHNWLIL